MAATTFNAQQVYEHHMRSVYELMGVPATDRPAPVSDVNPDIFCPLPTEIPERMNDKNEMLVLMYNDALLYAGLANKREFFHFSIDDYHTGSIDTLLFDANNGLFVKKRGSGPMYPTIELDGKIYFITQAKREIGDEDDGQVLEARYLAKPLHETNTHTTASDIVSGIARSLTKKFKK